MHTPQPEDFAEQFPSLQSMLLYQSSQYLLVSDVEPPKRDWLAAAPRVLALNHL